MTSVGTNMKEKTKQWGSLPVLMKSECIGEDRITAAPGPAPNHTTDDAIRAMEDSTPRSPALNPSSGSPNLSNLLQVSLKTEAITNSFSLDVLNLEIKSIEQTLNFQQIKQREQLLRTNEMFGPYAERKRLGVLKYHMKKRHERVENLNASYQKNVNDVFDLLVLSLENALNLYESEDDEKKRGKI